MAGGFCGLIELRLIILVVVWKKLEIPILDVLLRKISFLLMIETEIGSGGSEHNAYLSLWKT